MTMHGEQIVRPLFTPDCHSDMEFTASRMVVEGARMVTARAARWVVLVMTALALLAVPAAAVAGAGEFDKSFGVGGTQGVVGNQYSPVVVTAAPAGKVLVAGETGDAGVFVTRLGADGSPDPSFGVDGRRELRGTNAALGAHDMIVLPDGGIVVVGWITRGANPSDALVVVVDPDGMGAAFVGLDNGGSEVAHAVALQSGKVLLAGFTSAGANDGDAVVWRYDPQRQELDRTFDLDGAAAMESGGEESASAIAVRPDGKIVVAGYTSAGSGGSRDAAVWRLKPDGGRLNVPNDALDTTFDVDGVAGVDEGGTEDADDLLLLADGRVLVGGSTRDMNGATTPSDGMVWQLKPNGGGSSVNDALDRTFGADGRARVGVADTSETIRAMTRQPDGSLVLAGDSGGRGIVWRLRPEGGAGDVAFGSAGSQTLPGLSADSVEVLADRRILVSGRGTTPGAFVSRLLGDPYTLLVARTGAGGGAVASEPSGIDCGSSCSGRFGLGTDVRLTAIPENGSVFAGWTGSGCSGTGDCAVTMDADRAVEARFEPAPGADTSPLTTPLTTDANETPPPPASFGLRTGVALKVGRLIRRGRLKVTVRNANAFAVTGVLAAASPRGLRRRRWTVPASGAVQVRLVVPRAALRRAVRTRVLRVVLRATVADPAGNTRTVLLRRRLAVPRRSRTSRFFRLTATATATTRRQGR